ncbi:E3 ubiquitin-protein ligase bre1 [Coemansia spiralis]|uniref:E3 ubiquitin protein ligase n=1 Tax=Coemansia spiralis TaxID=417178 RepID=A0A9W8GQS0_9FUNG|nr:E3 ubiquitin-protein ligase bre1 [Coemansia spiralis]
MTERKRRSEDGRDLDDQPQPTLVKKRHTAKESDFGALPADFDENAAMLDLESIREFQKEAIWRQMQEYKRDAARAQQKATDVERRQAKWAERIGGVCSLWDQAVRDLEAIVNDTSDPTVIVAQHEPLIDVILPVNFHRRTAPSGSSDSASEVPSTEVAQSSLERFNASVNNVLKQLQHKSETRSPIDWSAAADRLSRVRVSQSEVDDLKSRVALLSRQLSEERDMLEEREIELRRALKRLDRSVCPTVRENYAHLALPTSDNTDSPDLASPDKSSINNNVVDVTDSQSLPTQPLSPAGGGGGSDAMPKAVTNGVSATSLQEQQEKADYVLLAERRLGEIEDKVRENTQLQSVIDGLRLQMASVPDHIIAESGLYKQVEASRDYYSAQAQRLQVEVERLFAEVAELKTSRGEFEDTIVTGSSTQRQALEVEMRRLQGDLIRVRHHRDQIQRELGERRAQDSVEDQKSAELKLLSDVRRERMNALISENKRLLAYVAVMRGDRAAFETFTDEELSKTTAVADELRVKLEQVVRRERHLSEQLDALSIGSRGTEDGATQDASLLSAANASAAQLQSARDEAAGLLRRVQKYEEVLGSVVDDQGRIGEDHGSELAAKQRRVDELTLQRDSLQKTSEMMERELQTICESFAKLEEQSTSKVWDLSAKEQAIARVVAEKCKYEEKFIGLNKDREAMRLANQALRAQNVKQLDHIKAIEEHDRALSQQLSLVRSEAEQATAAWQAAAAKLQDAQQRTVELEEQARVLEDRAVIAAQALAERTEALAAAEHERRRTQECLDLANRRVSESERPPTDQTGLAKLCADYKALLKCPTCQTNFKSHVLLRCMHVFCKQCIDSRIETRQRKCPSCSEPFGAKDVRQIYL